MHRVVVDPAVVGEPHATGCAHKKPGAEVFFQRRHVMADAALGHAQAAGCTAQAAGARGLDEDAHGIERQRRRFGVTRGHTRPSIIGFTHTCALVIGLPGSHPDAPGSIISGMESNNNTHTSDRLYSTQRGTGPTAPRPNAPEYTA